MDNLCKNLISTAAKGEYPPIQIAEPNPQYSQLLAIDLASAQSELTSIMQYIYQSWRLYGPYQKVGEVMECIARVEMHHMEILGKLITLLGGNPKYMSVQHHCPTFWQADMVAYSGNLRQMIQEDIVLEQAAIDTYLRQFQIIKNPYIQAIIQRIIEDEKVHLAIFHKYLTEVC